MTHGSLSQVAAKAAADPPFVTGSIFRCDGIKENHFYNVTIDTGCAAERFH